MNANLNTCKPKIRMKKKVYVYPEHATCCGIIVPYKIIKAATITEWNKLHVDMCRMLDEDGIEYYVDKVEIGLSKIMIVYLNDNCENCEKMRQRFKELRRNGWTVIELQYGSVLHQGLNKWIQD